MLYFIGAVMVGLALLVWSADRFIAGASGIAVNLGVTPLLVGMTVVAIGTSAPEMLVSVVAAWDGNTGLAVGNAIGSNIANVGLVVGATAVVRPLTVSSQTLRREFPVMFVVMLAVLGLMADGYLGRLDGLLLVLGAGLVTYLLVRIGTATGAGDPLLGEYAAEIPTGLSTGRAILWAIAGLALLLLSSRLLVWGAVNIAQVFGVSDLLIGLTVVAIGTSLPELAASVAGAARGEPDIAMGNVIGSNMFNLLPVLGLPGLIHPAPMPGDALHRDYPVMLFLSVVLFGVAYGFRGPRRINRLEGALLLLLFAGYLAYLYLEGR
jgi:cation:H+ antiporter